MLVSCKSAGVAGTTTCFTLLCALRAPVGKKRSATPSPTSAMKVLISRARVDVGPRFLDLRVLLTKLNSGRSLNEPCGWVAIQKTSKGAGHNLQRAGGQYSVLE